MEFEIENGILTKYSGESTNVVIPEGVTVIGENAFYGCQSLSAVKLPATLKRIEHGAFMDTQIQAIDIPDSVETIEFNTFNGCKELAHVRLPSGLIAISGGLFTGCKNLENIALPKSITQIGAAAFWGCGMKTVELPAGVKAIGKAAFKYSKIERLELPEGLETIEEDAFEGCENLTEISFPTTLKMIGYSAFNGCKQISGVHINDLSAWLYTENHSVFSSDYTLYVNGEKLEQLVFPMDIDAIGASAFAGCNNFTNISIPAHIKRIGGFAFGRCSALKKVEIAGETEIGYNAFCGCENLEEVILSDNVKIIDSEAFGDCKALKTIIIPSGINKISERMFQSCTSLCDITIPDSVQVIEKDAFSGCRSLKRINLPKGLSEISAGLFEYSGLEQIVLPEGVETINYGAFGECQQLKEISIPSTVKTVNEFAFNNAANLEMLVIKCKLNVFKKTVFKAAVLPKNVYITQDQLEDAKKLFKNASYFDLDGQALKTGKKTTPANKPAPAKKEKTTAPGVSGSDAMRVVYPADAELPAADFSPIVMSKGVPKGFAKPEIKELYVQVGKAKFTVTLKVASKLPAIWKRYYVTKEDGVAYDPRLALQKASYSGGYRDDGTDVYVSAPLQGHIPGSVAPLPAEEIARRLSCFVTILNQCVQIETVIKIMEKAEKKKNGLLYKGRVLHLAYLDLVDDDGTTYELVAKNEDETQMYIELRSKVPVVDDLFRQSYLLKKAR